MDAIMKPQSSVQEANAKRWSADDAWRGYRRSGGEILLEDRIKALVSRIMSVDFAPVATAVETGAVNLDSDECLPFADATFDVVTCLETLEHAHDTDHLVREIRRVLKDDGYAVLSVPRIDGLLTVTMLALGLQPPAIE